MLEAKGQPGRRGASDGPGAAGSSKSDLEALVRAGVGARPPARRGPPPARASPSAPSTSAAEECRDARAAHAWLLGDLWRDLTARAAGSCAARPRVTAVAVATLAGAIGANTAVFSLVHRLLLAPLPVARPDRLVALAHGDDDARPRHRASPTPSCARLEVERAADPWPCSARGGMRARHAGRRRRSASRPSASSCSGGFFEVLGVAPAVGRLFTVDDDRDAGGAPRRGLEPRVLAAALQPAIPAVVGRAADGQRSCR